MKVARWLMPVVALALLSLMGWGLTRDARRLDSALVGERAPAFRLASMYDPADSLSLEDFSGKVVVLNFWASWCAPCIIEHPILQQLHETYDPEDVALVGVLFQDTPDRGQAFIDHYGGDWPIIVDPRSETAIRYGVYGVPETFFIGADGVVALRHDLAVTWDLVEQKVDSLLVARGTVERLESASQ